MKDFLRYSKNRFLYSFFKLLILIAIGFLIGSLKVNAAIVQYKFIDYDSTSSTLKRTNFAANEEYTYTRDYVLFNGNERFFAFSYCATARFDFGFPNDFEGVTSRIGYSTGGSCNVQGYQGSVYTVYFVAQQVNDAGNGNLSIMFNTKVINTANYNVFIDVLSLTSVDSIPAGVQIPTYDGEFNTLNTKIDSVDQALSEVKKAQEGQTAEQKKTNDKLDQAENTRKGIWETIKSIPGTIGTFFDNLGTKIGNFFKDLLDGILEGLKKLFIPEDNYFKNWFDDFKTYFEEKLGFIATPFTIIIDFVNSYLNLSSSNDIIIDVPDITVPNFEENKIISATTFNWSQTLRSKQALNTLWQLYLSFIDVYLILNFINLCESKYNRIFGGDTTNYEYYTVEDSYTFDNDTGEVLSARRNERTTTRKKVE